MEILIQSVLQNAKRWGSSVHIRYLERKGQPVEKSRNGKNGKDLELTGKSREMRNPSYVIIHKSYSYLDPVVRSMFEEAEDVRVLVDRRFHERRQVSVFLGVKDLRKHRDRRRSTPMLDILISVDS
jgi:hypothetical protein